MLWLPIPIYEVFVVDLLSCMSRVVVYVSGYPSVLPLCARLVIYFVCSLVLEGCSLCWGLPNSLAHNCIHVESFVVVLPHRRNATFIGHLRLDPGPGLRE